MFEPEAKSICWGVSPMLLIVGGLCHIVSIAAPHWLADPEAHMGLWTYCTRKGGCMNVSEKLADPGELLIC